MKFARDIAKSYFDNGYYPIPTNHNSKIPRIKWNDLYDHYDFNKAWENWLDCDMGIMLKNVVCVDFDRHSDKVCNADYYDYLRENYPKIFENAIIEKTQNNGIHVYYKRSVDLPDSEWKLPVKINNIVVYIEVKTGKRLAFCNPGLKNNKSSYTPIQGSFDSIPVDKLPYLPTVFIYYPQESKKVSKTFSERNTNDDITDKMREEAFEVIVRIYARKAHIESQMNHNAYGMAGYMAGLGYSDMEIERALRSYESYGHRKFRPREIDDIIKHKKTSRNPIYPYKQVKDSKRKN